MLRINVKQLFSFIFVGLIAISCDDDSNPMASEEHVDADGFILESDETEMYREFEGAIVVNNLNLTTTGETNTLELSIHFLDHDGNEIEHEEEEGEEEEELTFQIADSSVISIAIEDHEEDGDDHDGEHHELGFELTGLSAGTTTFTISLMHDGHADYTSLPITVTVTQ